MKIKPSEGEVQLKFETAQAGALNLSSRDSAVEVAEVLAVGPGVEGYKKGDTVMVKSWAVDHINHEGKMYHFASIITHGLKAVIE